MFNYGEIIIYFLESVVQYSSSVISTNIIIIIIIIININRWHEPVCNNFDCN